MASVPGVLDFIVPYILFNVQSTVLAHPFWTSSCRISASTSNSPCIHLPHKRESNSSLQSAQSRGPPDLVRPCPKTRLRHVLSINKTPLWSIGKGSEEAHASSLPFSYGPEGSRTPVRKPIPCSSTIIVDCLTFPPVHGNQHPCTFSSFMIRPASQSFDTVVSYMFEAWVLKCRCFKIGRAHV